MKKQRYTTIQFSIGEMKHLVLNGELLNPLTSPTPLQLERAEDIVCAMLSGLPLPILPILKMRPDGLWEVLTHQDELHGLLGFATKELVLSGSHHNVTNFNDLSFEQQLEYNQIVINGFLIGHEDEEALVERMTDYPQLYVLPNYYYVDEDSPEYQQWLSDYSSQADLKDKRVLKDINELFSKDE